MMFREQPNESCMALYNDLHGCYALQLRDNGSSSGEMGPLFAAKT